MRNAQFTAPDADEVMLTYIIDAHPSSSLHGTPGVAFYDIALYRKRQAQHGLATYPEPLPAN